MSERAPLLVARLTRRRDGRWVAVEVERSGGGGEHGGADDRGADDHGGDRPDGVDDNPSADDPA